MSETAFQTEPVLETMVQSRMTFPARQQVGEEEEIQTVGVLSFSPATYPMYRDLPSPADFRIFRNLVRQWQYERGSASSTTKIVNCESYRAIIGMGKRAIPLILWQLQQEPDFWFAALRALTHEDPVPNPSRGNVRRMTEAWLTWGVRCGYIEPISHRANGHQ